MLMKNLKKEYDMRYNIMRYKKLHKLYLYSCFEKNNFNLLYKTLEDLQIEQEKNFNQEV